MLEEDHALENQSFSGTRFQCIKRICNPQALRVSEAEYLVQKKKRTKRCFAIIHDL
jgi:hypothetical protein